MKKLLFNSQFFVFGSFFFMLVNVSDSKGRIPDSKTAVAITKNQDCLTYLQQMNNYLNSQQEDGILDANSVESYESCLYQVTPTLDYRNDIDAYIFLLNCYTNLMDYYDYDGGLDDDEYDEKLEEIEDMIYEISQ